MIVDTLPNGFWPLQIIGAMNILERRAHLLADHPGAGKTLQAMLAAEMDGLFTRDSAILITAPKTACQLTWAPEVRRRIESQYAVVVADLTGTLGRKRKSAPSVAERNEYLGEKIVEAQQLELPLIVIVNFDGLRWPHAGPPKMENLWRISWDMFAIDESHLILPTKIDDVTKMTQVWRGLTQLAYSNNPILLSMSGTPDRGKLENRYGHWKFLYRDRFRSYDSWVYKQFQEYWDADGRKQIGRLRNEAEWVAFDRVNMTRRTKAEMLQGLPEKQWAGDGAVLLPMTEAQREQLDAWEQKLEGQVDEGEVGLEGARLAAYIRGRQLAVCTWDQYDNRPWRARRAGVEASAVLGWIDEWLESRGHHPDNFDASLGKVVITSYFTEVLAWLQDELEALGYGRPPILSGDSSLHEKLEMEEAFQRGDSRILLFSGHLGVSINLDAADDMIFTDLVHDPDKVEQTEDRIHRASRMHQVTYWRLVTEDTVMEEIVATVDERYATTRRTYDGSRGVSFARKLLDNHLDGIAA